MRRSGRAGRTEGTTDLSEAILEVAASAILTLDVQGRVVRWNRAATELTGISVETVRGCIFQNIMLFPDEIDRWEQELNRMWAGSAPRRFESRWKGRDAASIPVTCSFSAICDASGHADYVVCTVVGARGGTDRDVLSREFVESRTAEFRDISRFIHETIAQHLVVLSFEVSRLEDMTSHLPSQVGESSALELVDRCCRDIRVISYMLAPPSTLEGTLSESIEQYTGYLREETGMAIDLDLDPVPGTVSPEAQLLIFHAIQEWTSRNVRRSRHGMVSVRLRSSAAATILELDTLNMIPSQASPAHAGWAAIRERARGLGGESEVAVEPTREFARISLPAGGQLPKAVR
jgi:PAS domain S-box-containing protein